MMDRLWRRLSSLVRRAKITSGTDGAEQGLTVADATGALAVEHVEPYGFTARPLSGAESIILEVSGSPDHPVSILAGDRRYRRTGMDAGDVSVYREGGQHMTLTADKVRIVCRYLEVVTTDGTSVTSLNGVVTGVGIDPYTGQTYASLGATSDIVRVEP